MAIGPPITTRILLFAPEESDLSEHSQALRAVWMARGFGLDGVGPTQPLEVVAGQSRKARNSLLICLAIRKLTLEFHHLRLDQEAIPITLQKVIDSARFSIEEAKLKNISIKKIPGRTKKRRQDIVKFFFDEALEPCLG